jgi:hypothetical protein
MLNDLLEQSFKSLEYLSGRKATTIRFSGYSFLIAFTAGVKSASPVINNAILLPIKTGV